MPVDAAGDPSISLWAFGLVPEALRGCPSTALRTGALLGIMVVGGGTLLAGRGRSATAWWASVLLFLLLAWFLRDRLMLLGDSRLWLHTAQEFGTHVPLYRAPLGALVMGGVGSLGKNPLLALQLLPVLCGGAAAAALARGIRRMHPGDGAPGAWLALALLFGQPLSFVFYGHIETYALLAAVLGLFLASLAGDGERPGVTTLLLLLAAGFTHLVGFLLVIPLLTAYAVRRPERRLAVLAGLLGALVAATAVVPALRAHGPLGMGWSPRTFLVYAADVVNGWILVGLPPGILYLVLGRPALDIPYARFLVHAAAVFMLVPFLRVFELGVYRDLDLFTPAFITVTFLSAYLLGRSPGIPRARLVLPLGCGALLLWPWVVLSICPAGSGAMEAQLSRGAMTDAARSYGFEALAFNALDENRLGEAESLMRRSIAATPGNRRLHGPLGEIQLARGDTTGAIESLERAMTTPRAPRTAPLLAELLTRRGRHREAIAVLESRRDEMLSHSGAAATLAVAYFRAGLPESTVAVGRARIRHDPRDHVAHFNLASGLAQLREYEAAIASLRDALDLAPERLEYHRALLRVMLRLPGGEERAKRYLEGLEPGLRSAVLGEG